MNFLYTSKYLMTLIPKALASSRVLAIQRLESMKIYLIRHGQSTYNVLGLCNDNPAIDVHLTELGIEQAKKLTEQLKDATWDQMFVSRLRRTQQTAELINKFHQAPVSIDARLDDNRSGFEGRPVSEHNAALELADSMWTARFNGGESFEDVKKRVKSFMDELEATGYESVAIISSRTIIQMFYLLLNDLPNEKLWDITVDKGSCREVEL